MARPLAKRGEFTRAQRRFLYTLEQRPDYRPRKGRTRQTLAALLRKGAVRWRGDQLELLVRLR